MVDSVGTQTKALAATPPLDEAPSKNALKKAVKEAAKAEAKARKKVDCVINKLSQDTNDSQLDDNIVNMDRTMFWAINKKYIDPVALRRTAIILHDAVKCRISGTNSDVVIEDKPKHKKNADVGMKKVVYSDTIWIGQIDGRSFSQDEEITLMDWANAIVEKVTTSTADPVTSLELKL
jgi:tRNA synthetases class I (E and Q), anti-codon binding domain